MKTIFFITILLLVPIAFAVEPFCGSSTFAACHSDSDCQKGGCSGQVCEAKGQGTVTTCEFRECYNATAYNLLCQCINNKCQWGYQDHTPYATTTPAILTPIKYTYNFLISLNPLLLLILGIILILVSKLAKFVGIVLIIFALIHLFLILLK